MATNYPSAYDTNTSGSLNNSKANKEPVVDVTYDLDATEWNTHADAVLALERKLGDGSTTPTSDGDVDEYNVRDILRFMTWRGDRAYINEHFLFQSHATTIVKDLNTASAFANVTGGCGVASITTAAATIEGWDQTNDHYHSRSTYYRCRFYVNSLPGTDGDYIQLGIFNAANTYVDLYVTRAGGSWGEWSIRVADAGAPTTTALTGSSVTAATWYVAEIITTSTGATGWIDRAGQGTGTEYTASVVAAPNNGYAHMRAAIFSNVGGEVFSLDSIGAGSTTIPL